MRKSGWGKDSSEAAKGTEHSQVAEERGEICYEALTDDVSYALVKALAGYDAAVSGAAERYEPSVVARYIISVASAFNKFYHECPILNAGEEEKKARILLVDAVQNVLEDACNLLGMECPEEM